MNKKYIKKIKCSLIMFFAIIVISIIACIFIGCGDKKNDKNEQLNICYGEIIRYDVYAYNAYPRREIVINSESGNRMCFEIFNFNSECENSIFKSKVGDMVSITYTTENNIVDYKIIKD